MLPQPDGRRLLDPESLARLARLTLEARRPMLGTVAGQHRSPHRGASVEFAEYREYMPGDDLRRLDWRAYARSDRFYIKEFEAETNLRLYLVLDGSGSMRYGTKDSSSGAPQGLSKFECARRMAALLASVAISQGDAAGLCLVGAERIQQVPPKRRPSHLAAVLRELERAAPAGPTRLVEALHEVAERAGRRGLIAVFSDLFCDPDALAEALQHLRYRRHDVVLFHLLERRELEFDFDRPTRFVDLESRTAIVADSASTGARYQAALAAYFAQLADSVRKSDSDYRRVLLDERPADALARFLLSRQPKRGRR